MVDYADDPYRYSYDPSGAEEREWYKQQRKWEREREREDDRAIERMEQREKERRQKEYEESTALQIEKYNKLIIQHYGETSRKILTEEDQQNVGKVAVEKMQFFAAYQKFLRHVNETNEKSADGHVSIKRTDPSARTLQLLEAVTENGLRGLQQRELDELQKHLAQFNMTELSKVQKRIKAEISERKSVK